MIVVIQKTNENPFLSRDDKWRNAFTSNKQRFRFRNELFPRRIRTVHRENLRKLELSFLSRLSNPRTRVNQISRVGNRYFTLWNCKLQGSNNWDFQHHEFQKFISSSQNDIKQRIGLRWQTPSNDYTGNDRCNKIVAILNVSISTLVSIKATVWLLYFKEGRTVADPRASINRSVSPYQTSDAGLTRFFSSFSFFLSFFPSTLSKDPLG